MLGELAHSDLEVVRAFTGWIVRAHLQGLRRGAELARDRVTATAAASTIAAVADRLEGEWSTR